MRRVVVFLFLSVVWAATANAQTPFYQGKTITIIVSTKAGDVYDLYPRLVAEFMACARELNPSLAKMLVM